MSPRARLVTIGGIGALSTAAAWFWQPGRTIYTDLDRVFYLPDPDLGWRLVEPGVFALGLELVSLAFGAWVMSAVLSAVRDNKALTGLAWAAALFTWLPALAVGALGRFPAGAELEVPSGVAEVPDGVHGGLEGLPAGKWTTVDAGRGVVARVPAGGETFDTRFDLVAPALLTGAPADLRQPIRFAAEADASSADTGVDGRTKSARKYLEAETHTVIRFEMTQLDGAEPQTDGSINFAASGEVQLMGNAHPTPVTGTLRKLDAGARERLGVKADAAIAVQASFSLLIADTALQGRASSFDAEGIELQVELIFVPNPSPPA